MSRSPKPKWTCEICFAPYVRSYSGQRTCGRACGAALRARTQPAPKPKPPGVLGTTKTADCRHCGTTFEYVVSRGPGRVYCSRKCSVDYHNSTRYRDRTQRDCPGCGQSFTPTHAGRVFCTATCRKRSTKHYRDRARRFGVPYEPINVAYVYTRDGWTCGICRRKVRKSAQYPHPMSPSLDHMIPMSRGGGHVLANVQLSHLACNWRKNAGFIGRRATGARRLRG